MTLLKLSVERGCLDLLEALLAEGADPSINKTEDETLFTTALLDSVVKMFWLAIELLIKHGKSYPNLLYLDTMDCD